MKKNGLKCFIYACLVMGGAGCSQDMEPLPEQGKQEVVFHITQAENPITKATLTGFEVGDSIGVYAVKRTDPGAVALPGQSGNQAHNAKWIKTEEGWMPASLADKIVFPQDGGKLDFYAYYPYSAVHRSPEAIRFVVKADQTTEEAQKTSDLMIAKNVTGINEGIVSLTFSHALAMVEVRVKAGNTVSPEAGLQVQMAGCATETSLNLGTQVLTPSAETGTISLARQEAEDEMSVFTFRGYVPAQDIPVETPLFRCILNGKIYIYKSESVSLLKGNLTPFELSLKAENE